MNGEDMARAGKIIFINRFFYPDHSATSQMLTDLAFHLAATGRTVQVISSRQRYDDPGARLPVREVVAGVRVYRVRSSRFGRHFLPGRAIDYLTFHLGALWRLLWLARGGDLLVAKTDPPLISVTVLPVVRLKRLRLVNWVQDLFPEVAEALGVRIMHRLVAGPLRWLRDRSLNTAAVNVVLGQRMAARIGQRGIDPARIAIIHNWSDGQAIAPVAAEENPLRREWGVADLFVVGYSGNLGRAHDHETVLEAASLLRDRAEILFLFIGGGAGLERLRRAVRERGLSNVRFQPYQPRARLALSLGVADLHWMTLLPELEGLIVPSKFYGIAAAGRPLLHVGDPEGEIGGLIRDAACGVTVRPGAARELAAWIAGLAADRGRGQEMGRRARRLFESRFDRPVAMAAWSRLLDRVGGW